VSLYGVGERDAAKPVGCDSDENDEENGGSVSFTVAN